MRDQGIPGNRKNPCRQRLAVLIMRERLQDFQKYLAGQVYCLLAVVRP